MRGLGFVSQKSAKSSSTPGLRQLSNSEPSNLEEEYFRDRAELLQRVDLAAYVDDPMVFCKRQKFAAMLARIEVFKQVLEVQGSIVECGVHKGNSLMMYAHLSATLEPYSINRKIIGFDSFEGLRSISDKDPAILNEGDFSNTSYEVLSEIARISDKNRPLSHIPKIELVRGDAVRTIPDYVAAHPELIVALLYIDFDIYEPTKVALTHLLPLVPKGGIVALDELNCAKWAGETKALKEIAEIRKLPIKRFPFDPWMSYWVVE